MPIHDMYFDNGIFHATQSGRLDGLDAQAFVEALRHYAENSAQPIVVLVDARKVESVSPQASLILMQGSSTPNVKMAVIATERRETYVQARTVGMMSERQSTHTTHVFQTYEEAERFAKANARTI
ncbi:MAG: hypothetical protein F9K46_17860 [Anaerolineae bacterium]|nr:MAG: hypothetical protein F9K46_17860 [Anaerolineae bacterium]MBZ0280838.1 hypothetical protein [Anaerolineae bacterium]